MGKRIGVKGEMIMDEELNLVATLEQENRMLQERNKILESELEIASNNGIDELRNKLDMADEDKFMTFRHSVKALAKCFEKGNMGVLIADIGDKVSIFGINAEMREVVLMAAAAATKIGEVIEEMGDEDRVTH